MTLKDVHEILGTMAWQYYVLLAIWGYFRFFRKLGINDSFRGALVIAEGLMILQVILGGFVWFSGLRPARTMHLLYGALLPAMIPLVHIRTEGRDGRPEILVYATVLLFSAGLVFRANYTGGVLLP